MNKFVPGEGNPRARIAFIGEAPSYDEEISGRPFTGPAGKIFDSCLRNTGINRNDVWVTNVFKYMIVPQSKSGRKIPAFKRAEMAGVDVTESIRKLRVELDDIKPNVIVPLGGTALWAIFGKDNITSYRGSILPGWNYKLVPTYHPAAVIKSGGEGAGSEYWRKVIIELDFRRASEQSTFPEINRPPRNLIVCTNSVQLQEFYDRGKQLVRERKRPIKLAVDIEAIHCIPVCIGVSYEKHCALSLPLWNHTPLVRISDIPSTDLAACWIIMNKMLQDSSFLIVGQNFKYDEDKINRLGFRISSLHSDTMLKAFAINPELSVGLAFNTSVYTEQPYYKDEGKEFDYKKHDINDLFRYNAMDACVTLEIDDRMDTDLEEIEQTGFYHNFLMKLHSLYLSIENTGFPYDTAKRNELLRKYIAWSEKLRYDIFKDTGNIINTRSPQQVDKLLYEILRVPRRAGTGEEVLTGLLNSPQLKKNIHKRTITNILEKRRVDKTIDNYLSALPDYDGRMKTTYFLCLQTGRTSTGMLEPPIRPKFEYRDEDRKLKRKDIGTGFQVLTKHGDIGGDVREYLIADAGHVIINVDSSQAEARVVALLANDEEMLALYDTNDIHALTASWFVGGTETDWSKRVLGYEHPNRFLGKTLRHAGHLGAKAKRASDEINTQARKYHINVNVSIPFAEVALNIFHRKCPNIREVFHKSVIACLDRNRILIAPIPYGIAAHYGGRRTFYDVYSDELFRQAFSYLPQRSISDNTKAAALRIRARIPDIKICVESHDSLTFMVPEQCAQAHGRIFKEEMERHIDFSRCSIPRRSLSIPAELEIGYDYRNLKKFVLEVPSEQSAVQR